MRDVLLSCPQVQRRRPELNDICKTVNVYDLDPDVFRKALETISIRQTTGQNSLEAKMVSCLEVVQGSPLPKNQKSVAALAIHFRLEALANFLKAGGARGFRHKALFGSDMLDSAIVTCAALEPIIKASDQVTFEQTSFEQRLFAIVKTVGSA